MLEVVERGSVGLRRRDDPGTVLLRRKTNVEPSVSCGPGVFAVDFLYPQARIIHIFRHSLDRLGTHVTSVCHRGMVGILHI